MIFIMTLSSTWPMIHNDPLQMLTYFYIYYGITTTMAAWLRKESRGNGVRGSESSQPSRKVDVNEADINQL